MRNFVISRGKTKANHHSLSEALTLPHSYMYLLVVLIGRLDCLCSRDWFVITLVLVSRFQLYTRVQNNRTGTLPKNFETGRKGTEIYWDNFQKIRKFLNFQKAENQLERKFPV